MTSSLRVLLVEDNPGDVELMQNSFAEVSGTYDLQVAQDGEEALEKLQDYKPDILLLDINLPKIDGHTVLARMKQEAHLSDIPVIMLTSSKLTKDIERAREAGANGFINKSHTIEPNILSSFVELVRTDPNTWTHLN